MADYGVCEQTQGELGEASVKMPSQDMEAILGRPRLNPSLCLDAVVDMRFPPLHREGQRFPSTHRRDVGRGGCHDSHELVLARSGGLLSVTFACSGTFPVTPKVSWQR